MWICDLHYFVLLSRRPSALCGLDSPMVFLAILAGAQYHL